MMNNLLTSDQTTRRLLLGGCLLMVLPVVFAVAGILFFGWPLVISTLPRGVRPVPPAASREVLVITTAFEGRTGDDPSRAIDTAIVETNSGGIRTGYLSQVVTSPEEAAEIQAAYNASIVVWGEYDAQMYTAHLLIEPRHLIEPEQISFTFSQGSDEQFPTYIADFTMGLALFYNGDIQAAQALWGTLPSTTLDREVVALYRGYAAFLLGDIAQARQHIGTALAEHPTADLYALQAEILLYTANFEAVLEATQAALGLDDTTAQAHLIRGDVLFYTQEYDAAYDAYTEAIRLMPERIELYQKRIALAEAAGNLDQAIDDVTTLIEQHPDRTVYLEQRAELYAQQGRIDEAVADIDTALTVVDRAGIHDPTYIRANLIHTRAQLYRTVGQYEAAIADYESILDDLPSQTTYVFGYGMAYWELGDEEQARTIWDNYLTSYYGANASAYNNLAWEMSQQAIYEPALLYAQQSLDLDPTSPNTLHTRGYIYLGLGSYQAALDDFDAALTQGLTYEQVDRDIADAYFGLGDYRMALTHYLTYLDVNPKPFDIAYILQQIGEARLRLADA